jgi:hypothetical protein
MSNEFNQAKQTARDTNNYKLLAEFKVNHSHNSTPTIFLHRHIDSGAEAPLLLWSPPPEPEEDSRLSLLPRSVGEVLLRQVSSTG